MSVYVREGESGWRVVSEGRRMGETHIKGKNPLEMGRRQTSIATTGNTHRDKTDRKHTQRQN